MELTFIFSPRVFGGLHKRNAFNWLIFSDLMILKNHDEYR
jgi:hypothetical protein